MGYEVTLKIKELDDKFKPTFHEKPNESDVNTYRNILCSFCMNCFTSDSESNTSLNTYQIIKSIRLNLHMFMSYIEEEWKWNLQDRLKKDSITEENEVYYCGWDYSRDNEYDKDYIINTTIDELFFISACVKTPNYFKEESQWYSKLDKIKDIVDDFQESYYEYLNHEFFDFYKSNEDSTLEESY